MNGFDVISVVCLACAGIAILRQRAGTFFIAANQTVISHSLSIVVEHGRLPSVSYVPRWVFHPQATQSALVIFGIATAILIVAVSLPEKRKSQKAVELRAMPQSLFWIVLVYFAFFAFSMRNISDVAYASKEQNVYWMPGGGLFAVAAAVLMYELYRRVREGTFKPLTAFLIYAAVFFMTDYSKGQTGMATGFVFSGAILFFGEPGTLKRPRLWIIGAFAGLLIFATVVRQIRTRVHQDGTAAVDSTVSNLAQSPDSDGEGIERAWSANEFATHTLECVSLYDSGNDRAWASVYRPFLYTFQPEFLVHLTGWERPREAAQELRDYFTTNGGIAIYGESYWNGGYLGVALILSAIFLGTYWIDTSRRAGFFSCILYCNYAPILLQGVGYGMSYEVRGLMNGLIVAGAYLGFGALFNAWRRLFGHTPRPGLFQT